MVLQNHQHHKSTYVNAQATSSWNHTLQLYPLHTQTSPILILYHHMIPHYTHTSTPAHVTWYQHCPYHFTTTFPHQTISPRQSIGSFTPNPPQYHSWFHALHLLTPNYNPQNTIQFLPIATINSQWTTISATSFSIPIHVTYPPLLPLGWHTEH